MTSLAETGDSARLVCCNVQRQNNQTPSFNDSGGRNFMINKKMIYRTPCTMIIENNEMKNTKLFRFFFGSRLIPVGFWTLFVLSVEHNIQRWEFIKENKSKKTREQELD